MTDQKLIRLWETNQFSPILRNPDIEKQLYEAMVAWRNENPQRFDAHHPTIGKIFSDREFFDYAMYLYNLDERRFVHYHHYLIPILRGMVMMLMMPPAPGNTPGSVGGTTTVPPAPEGIIYNNTPTPPESLTVPEPPGIVPMALGIGLLGAALLARRRGKRI
jgi:hypothetical protein